MTVCPTIDQVRIRVSPDSWSCLLLLANEVREEGHLDVYFIFRKLSAVNAFAFCAERQVLYPGAPLFDSPNLETSLGEPDDSTSTKTARARHQFSTYMNFLKPRIQGTNLDDSITCLSESLKQYTETKRGLNPDVGDTNTSASSSKAAPRTFKKVDSDDDDDDDDEDGECNEEFLPGLNFITYPVSCAAIKGFG